MTYETSITEALHMPVERMQQLLEDDDFWRNRDRDTPWSLPGAELFLAARPDLIEAVETKLRKKGVDSTRVRVVVEGVDNAP